MPVSLSSSLTETQVEGKITPTVERKFESNLTRLFTSQEGHSQARTWAVRILSCPCFARCFNCDLRCRPSHWFLSRQQERNVR